MTETITMMRCPLQNPAVPNPARARNRIQTEKSAILERQLCRLWRARQRPADRSPPGPHRAGRRQNRPEVGRHRFNLSSVPWSSCPASSPIFSSSSASSARRPCLTARLAAFRRLLDPLKRDQGIDPAQRPQRDRGVLRLRRLGFRQAKPPPPGAAPAPAPLPPKLAPLGP